MDYKLLDGYEDNKSIYLEDTSSSSIVNWSANKIKRTIRTVFRKKQVKPVISERSVEYPLLFQSLNLAQGVHILDFGCVESLLPLHLCALGYRVTGLDFRPYPLTHENFDFIQSDILAWDPPEAVYDAVISISTIEHIGLTAYGDPANEKGDQIAITKLMHSLKPDGRMFLTVPAGRPCIERGMRIYDTKAIRSLVPGIETIRLFQKEHRYTSWHESTSEQVDRLVYDDYHTRCPAQGVAFIIARKS
jgi:2-polyprenyl-3-methyl-5-hydroxy-6-metoxy-1,4-benzoquinol methylase